MPASRNKLKELQKMIPDFNLRPPHIHTHVTAHTHTYMCIHIPIPMNMEKEIGGEKNSINSAFVHDLKTKGYVKKGIKENSTL